MADEIRKNLTLFAKKESNEGTVNAPVAGDAILAADIQLDLQRDWHQRAYQGAPGVRPGVAGAQTGPGVSFSTDIRPNGTTNTLEVDELFEACMGATSTGTGDTTITGAASTATSINVVSETNFTAGNMLAVETATADEYEVAGVITAVAAGVLTVAPGLSFSPTTAGKKVKEMRTHQVVIPPAAVNSLSVDVYYNAASGDAKRARLLGCRGSFKISSPKAGAIPMVAWAFKAWNWALATATTRPTPTYDTAAPKPASASKFKLGTLLTDVFEVEVDAGISVSPKLSQQSALGIYGLPAVDCKPTGSFKIHPAHNSVTQFTDWIAGTEVAITQQFGVGLFGTWAYCIPKASRTVVASGDDAGIGTNDVTFEANIQSDAVATSGHAAIYVGVL